MAHVLRVVVREAHELLDLLHICWLGPGQDISNLARVHVTLSPADPMAQILYLKHPKVALLALCLKAMCLQAVEGIAQVSFVLSLGVGEHDYIIQIYSDKLIKYRAKHLLHQLLKGTWCIYQAKQ